MVFWTVGSVCLNYIEKLYNKNFNFRDCVRPFVNSIV